ncbi:hypothetical protein LWI28_026595 [Acer negundo]|uniref:RNase H type-1 domain-containing protein n=1 Tax=Acer negundo TaxID=4023 RepID=A0AAD5IHB2_ACENE|nr:hypothetical protein LWI28_026595 [Acer negundo]
MASTFKINYDIAIFEDQQLVGVGILIRDSFGHVCTSSTRRITACFSQAVVEATAVLVGMKVVVDAGLLPTILESDAKGVVDLINSNKESCSVIGYIIK